MNFIDDAQSENVAYASQHGHDGEETTQPFWKQFAPRDGWVRLDG